MPARYAANLGGGTTRGQGDDAPARRERRRGDDRKWLKQPGDTVAKYEPLLEVITDKVNAEVPSPFAGVLKEILAEEGATVPNNAEIAVIETEDEAGGDESPRRSSRRPPPATDGGAAEPRRAAAAAAKRRRPTATAAPSSRPRRRRSPSAPRGRRGRRTARRRDRHRPGRHRRRRTPA